MRLLIFGATGTIGIKLVEQALNKGDKVTAFVRTPGKLGIEDENLRVIQGNVLNFTEVAAALEGHDTVLIALGAGLKGRIRSEGTKNIVMAMEKSGVRNLVCQTTLAAGESYGNLNLKWRLIFGIPLRWALADHEHQEKIVKQSNLNWTIIRPAAFTDGPVTGNYKHGFSGKEKKLALKISRSDVAQFMLKQTGKRELFKANGFLILLSLILYVFSPSFGLFKKEFNFMQCLLKIKM